MLSCYCFQPTEHFGLVPDSTEVDKHYGVQVQVVKFKNYYPCSAEKEPFSQKPSFFGP